MSDIRSDQLGSLIKSDLIRCKIWCDMIINKISSRTTVYVSILSLYITNLKQQKSETSILI